MEIFAQILGLIATGLIIFAYQFRSNRIFFMLQMCSAAFFTVNMLLLDAYGGFVLNLLAAGRGVFLSLPNGKGITKLNFWIVNIATVAGYGILALWGQMSTLVDWLLPLQFVFGTWLSWRQSGRAIRMGQLIVMSPICLVYNSMVFSIGGIATECFNILSISISLIRFGWNGFETATKEKEKSHV